MFDIGATELLLIAVIAILVIGPKDMPLAFRTAGRWIGKVRRVSGQFRAGLDNIVREAEMEDMEAKWKAQNEKIMRENPDAAPSEMTPADMMPPEKRAEVERIVREKEAAEEARQAAQAAEARGEAVRAEAAATVKPVAVEEASVDQAPVETAKVSQHKVSPAAPDPQTELDLPKATPNAPKPKGEG